MKIKLASNRRRGRSRAQAAIFDGITFLLMTGFACSLVYSVVTGYGDTLNNALYSFHELNYLQSAVKALYYINLQQLSGIGVERDVFGDSSAYTQPPALDDAGTTALGCSRFASATGAVTVLDLLKRDLSDKPSDSSAEPSLDDRFWSSPDKPSVAAPGVTAPGKQALRCALKELMKPFTLAGYDYYAEVLNPQGTPPYKAIDVFDARVTSNASMANPNTPLLASDGTGSGCAYAQSVAGGSHGVLSMDVPLRVSLGTSCTQAQSGIACQRDYILRVCVWQTR